MRLIMYDIGLALQHCHRDLKMLDVPRVGDRIKLIDMDAAATSGQSFLGAKFSSGVLPPEMFAELSDAQVTKFGAYWQSRTENDDELWHKVEPRSVLSAGPGIKKQLVFAVKSYHCLQDGSPDCADAVPYPPVLASPAVDTFLSGERLLAVNRDDDLMSGEEYRESRT